jgi:hypothetical protein
MEDGDVHASESDCITKEITKKFAMGMLPLPRGFRHHVCNYDLLATWSLLLAIWNVFATHDIHPTT